MKFYIIQSCFSKVDSCILQKFCRKNNLIFETLDHFEKMSKKDMEQSVFFCDKKIIQDRLTKLNSESYYFIISDDQNSEIIKQNCFMLAIDDLDEIIEILNIIKVLEKQLDFNNEILAKQKLIDKESDWYIKEIKVKLIDSGELGSKDSKWFVDTYIQLLIFQHELYACISRFEIEKKILEGIKGQKIIKKATLVSESTFLNVFNENREDIFLPMYNLEPVLMLHVKFGVKQLSRRDFFVIKFFQILVNSLLLKFEKHENLDREELTFLEIFFSMIYMPAVIFSSNEEMLLHNPQFIRLGLLPNQCLRYENNQIAEIKNIVYRVNRSNISHGDERFTYFAFITDVSLTMGDKTNATVAELGIISGSIAHELNNPLAGMLGAINLLQLEDDLAEEVKNSLSEMKESLKRCKDLVGIFLGFSKMRPISKKQASISSAFLQSMNLLRFRMVESNVRYVISIKDVGEIFEHSVNQSIISMIFYLTLSEIMTLVSHMKLLEESENFSRDFIHGEMIESSNEIVINFKEKISKIDYLNELKLLNYLIGHANLDVLFDPFKIVFTSKR